MQIKKIKISELIPAYYNPRQISSSEMDKLIKSIKEYGNVQPLVVNKKNMSIISGHQRLQACIKLNYTEIDCVLVNLDDSKEKALNLAMNKISGEWDFYKLKGLLSELDNLETVDLTGFDSIEVDGLMGKLNADSFFGATLAAPPPLHSAAVPLSPTAEEVEGEDELMEYRRNDIYEPVEYTQPIEAEEDELAEKKYSKNIIVNFENQEDFEEFCLLLGQEVDENTKNIYYPERVEYNYGVPYMGSKRKISYDLIAKMKEYKPNAKYFYDLFGGGGAMSFTALQMGYKVIYNEFDTNLSNFLTYIADRIKNKECSKYGLFPEEFYKFVTREEFMIQKNLNTPYAEFCRIVYSFGNNRKTYLFNPELEEIKHIMHNAVVFQDEEELKKLNDLLNTDFIMPEGGTINKRRLNLTRQVKKYNKRIDLENLEQLQRIQQLERLERLEQLQNIQQLQNLERLQQLEILNKSYDDINIPYPDDEVIIYCDPPYRNTVEYVNNFDVEKFDNWVKNNNKTIFISEYDAPFEEIFSISKRCTYSSTANGERLEKLYIKKAEV